MSENGNLPGGTSDWNLCMCTDLRNCLQPGVHYSLRFESFRERRRWLAGGYSMLELYSAEEVERVALQRISVEMGRSKPVR